MAQNTNRDLRKALRSMTRDFRADMRAAAYTTRDNALAEERGDDPRLRMVAERLDRELASHKASLAERFARFGVPEGTAGPTESRAD
jgi:hypothetical protein